jgi:hypothetical protein
MSDNRLQDTIDKYLQTYKMTANHTTNKVYDEDGNEQGIYDILNHSDGEDDGKIHIGFHVAMDKDLTLIPTLVIRF